MPNSGGIPTEPRFPYSGLSNFQKFLAHFGGRISRKSRELIGYDFAPVVQIDDNLVVAKSAID